MQNFFYRVGKGETVFSVAEKFDIPTLSIINENNLKKELDCGDLLVLNKTPCKVYTVQPTDTLVSIAKRFCTSESQIMLDNGIDYVFYGLKIIL